jgi:hypothetical protein
MEKKHVNLKASLDRHKIDPRVLRNLAELAYTAEQTGLMPFLAGVHGEDLVRVYQLVKLAESLKAQSVPDDLRM